jgi:hypothetical protein
MRTGCSSLPLKIQFCQPSALVLLMKLFKWLSVGRFCVVPTRVAGMQYYCSVCLQCATTVLLRHRGRHRPPATLSDCARSMSRNSRIPRNLAGWATKLPWQQPSRHSRLRALWECHSKGASRQQYSTTVVLRNNLSALMARNVGSKYSSTVSHLISVPVFIIYIN